MNTYKITFQDKDFKKYKKFIKKLDISTQAKLIRTVDLLEKHGVHLPMPFSKKISRNIWELRVLGKQHVRILYTFQKNIIFFLRWFIKKKQKIPSKELRATQKKVALI